MKAPRYFIGLCPAKRRSEQRGFALVTVLCILMVVSGVALALAAGMRAQVRAVANDRGGLEAEQLCAAAQDMVAYLASRGLGTPLEKLDGLPVEVVLPAFKYLIHFPSGDVELYLDAEDGKLNLSTAPPALLQSFFATWSDEPLQGIQLAAAARDWRDLDDIAEPQGAEANTYSPLGYSPRNRGFGVADAPLLKGLSFDDFRERLVGRRGAWVRRAALTRFLTNAAVGATINPNFAPQLVLRAVPGLSDAQASKILSERRLRLFKDLADFSARVGMSGANASPIGRSQEVMSGANASPVGRSDQEMPPDDQAFTFLHFSRKVPGILVVARSHNGLVVRSERRVAEPPTVQFNVFPDYAVESQAGVHY